MILVTGSTGNFGRATIDFLLSKISADEFSAFARDENKAADLKAKGVNVRIGNYDDKSSLLTALKGIDKLLLVSGDDIPNRQKQHRNVINAAKESGVRHIIYTSFLRKNETETSPLGIIGRTHIETDKMIKESGIPYTIMLNNLYADILPMFFGETVLESGIFLPAGEGGAGYASRTDMAEVAANLLVTDGHTNKEYIISNSENYTMHDAASIISEFSGNKILYHNPAVDTYKQTLSHAGVPGEVIDLIAGFSEAIKQGEFETDHSDMERLLGRKPTTLNEFFKSVYG